MKVDTLSVMLGMQKVAWFPLPVLFLHLNTLTDKQFRVLVAICQYQKYYTDFKAGELLYPGDRQGFIDTLLELESMNIITYFAKDDVVFLNKLEQWEL